MDLKTVKNVLLDERNVESINCIREQRYLSKTYDCLVYCTLVVDGKQIPIAIGINDTWRTNLFDFYIRDYSIFPFIPHVDKNGKICLYDMEAALVAPQFDGVLVQCVHQAINIIRSGISGDNKTDFIEEFNSYWAQLSNAIEAKFDAPTDRKNGLQKYIYELPKVKASAKYVEKKKQIAATVLYSCPVGSDMFNTWEVIGTQKNGLYICADLDEYLFPPDPRQNLSLDYVNMLLGLVSAESIEHYVRKIGSTLVVVFDLLQPNGSRVIIGAYCTRAEATVIQGKYRLSSKSNVQPISITRLDTVFLQSRTADTSNPLCGKRFLLIGCGSIGGFLSEMLSKSGCNDLTIIDSQLFLEENIYRNVLGMRYVGQYKASALADYLQNDVPGIKVTPISDRIEDLVTEGSIDFQEYDCILAATGNHNVNRWINSYMKSKGIKIPVVYSWNEPLDIGCHVLFIDYDTDGDYEKIFADEGDSNYDKTAYCCSNQIITRNLSGCGGSYIPYGSEVSIQSAMLTVDTIKRYYTGRITGSLVLSCKGNGYFFHCAGLKHTKRYESQADMIVEENLSDY